GSATPACTPAPCTIGDADGNGSSTHGPLTGVISSGDVDYFHFVGEDNAFAVSNAVATTTSGGFRLCVFVNCPSSTTELSGCGQGSSQASAPAGMVGCCSTAGSVEVDHNCSGLNDSAGVYIRLDQAN